MFKVIIKATQTACKMSKYGVFSSPCFLAFKLNTDLNISHAVAMTQANVPLAKLSLAFLHFGCMLDYVIYGQCSYNVETRQFM